jgi:hypothetical protein
MDGKAQGDPLELSLYQLRSLQTGVPLEIEVVGFEGDTLVWEIDPNTGRRSYLTTGSWTPYQSAIQNVTARLVLDLRKDPSFVSGFVNGLPPLTVGDTRVFCYNPNGTYKGSPPDIRLGDAFVWAFEAVESDIGPVVTIRDPISKSRHSSPLALWEFSFDRLTIDRILSNPAKYGNVFNLPLEPGNPSERVYTCSAPPPEALQNPKIYWATCDPATRRIRAISRDVRGIKEMRFKPDPAADYNGELMRVGFNPEDVHQQFFYTYELPKGYRWTGNEQVVAINRANKQTVLPVQIEGGQLGFLINSGSDGVNMDGFPPSGNQGYSLAGAALSTLPLHDFNLAQSRDGAGTLTVTLTPVQGGLHDALYVVDALDPDGNPVYILDYNYLRKQVFGNSVLTDTIPATATNTPPPARTYCVRSPNGVLSVVKPVYATADAAAPYRWQIGELEWRCYDGM